MKIDRLTTAEYDFSFVIMSAFKQCTVNILGFFKQVMPLTSCATYQLLDMTEHVSWFPSLKVKNRIGVMRYVVLHGRLWDDLYIGFQNHISRDPDTYHHKYTHFSKIKTLWFI